MVDTASDNLSDLVGEEEYNYIQDMGIGPFDELISSTDINQSNNLGQGMLEMINSEETLCMNDFEYLTENKNFPRAEYQTFPPDEPKELCNTDYSGPYNFEVFIDPNGQKNPWEYSSVLNKIFIDFKHKFPINFSVKSEAGAQNLFIRIMPMFEEDRYLQELVYRCICHEQLQDPMNIGISELVAQHIIRCDNSGARYCGDKNVGRRLSIIIPLSSPQAGTDSVKEFFQFVCKNSCVGGMNRRPIQVVFSLEDEFGNVHGRRAICVRICSCPKRDKEKEERKKESHTNPPAGKKRKLEKKVANANPEPSADTRTFALNITITGQRNYNRTVEFIKTLMLASICELDENVPDDNFKKSLAEIQNIQNSISE